MATADKDTIYVDVDDEITTIIDKVRNSDGKIVALVLPKRASVFQSIVNMKLLKRSAESAKKHLVLVTTEASLMPLAGAVGLHVAPTPQSKPEIPTAAEAAEEADEPLLEDEADEEYTADNAGDKPVGELAKRSGHVMAADEAAAVTLPDEGEEEAGEGESSKLKKVRKNHSLKVPDFNKFRMRLFLVGLLGVLAIVGLYYALVVMPKAAITITTNASAQNVSLTATLDPSAQTFDPTKMVLPSKAEQQQKTTSQQVNTTGQKNTGTAATGTVIMKATACFPHIGTPSAVAAGTGVTTNGLTFITQEKASFSYTGNDGSGCNFYQAGPIDITAQTGGTKYNVSSVTFTVAGRSDVTATGSASGGTDNVINIVAQADIDSAVQKLAAADTTAIQTSLEQALRLDGLYPLPQTFAAGTPVVTNSANVGDTADTVTVTQAVTYTMYGAKQADLDALIKQNVDKQIDTSNQTIQDDGLGGATISVVNTANNTVQISLQTQATVGPDINAATIKKQAAGKKIGDVKALVNTVPGVTNVDVKLSPFWVSSVPTNLSKITVTISKAKS